MPEIQLSHSELERVRDAARRIWQELNPATSIDGKPITNQEMVTISWIEAVTGELLKLDMKVRLDTPDSEPETEY